MTKDNKEPVATSNQSLQVEQLLKDMLDTLPYNTPEYWIGRIKQVLPMYTTPPAAQRQWVGLTDEEIQTIWRHSEHMDVNEVCQAIESKLKEKNT
jgi:hypothetical protein